VRDDWSKLVLLSVGARMFAQIRNETSDSSPHYQLPITCSVRHSVIAPIFTELLDVTLIIPLYLFPDILGEP
jgi:hypothetical protein